MRIFFASSLEESSFFADSTEWYSLSLPFLALPSSLVLAFWESGPEPRIRSRLPYFPGRRTSENLFAFLPIILSCLRKKGKKKDIKIGKLNEFPDFRLPEVSDVKPRVDLTSLCIEEKQLP